MRGRRALGPDVDIEIEAYDECNTVIDVKGTIRAIRAAGAGFVGLVGVQSNQFPRALDLARQFRDADVPVVIGGFHVSGCISMLPELTPELQEALDLGVMLYAGEGEGRMADFLRDIDSGRTQADLQLPEGHAGHGSGDAADPAAPGRDPRRRPLHELRCRARLSVPVQLLHHHQCAGPQVALSHARRRRRHRARQRQAGHHALLHHRRQFRAQPELGADPRPADRAAREGRLQDQAAAAGRHALPPHSGLHREGGARRLHRGVHRA